LLDKFAPLTDGDHLCSAHYVVLLAAGNTAHT